MVREVIVEGGWFNRLHSLVECWWARGEKSSRRGRKKQRVKNERASAWPMETPKLVLLLIEAILSLSPVFHTSRTANCPFNEGKKVRKFPSQFTSFFTQMALHFDEWKRVGYLCPLLSLFYQHIFAHFEFIGL